MNVPSGYSALDLVGFTDKGDYSPSATYVKNDLVHYNGAIWKCLIDDTTGIVPTTGVNWDIWIDQSTSLDGLTDVEITSPTDGQEVTYDATTQKWKNTSKIQSLTNEVKGHWFEGGKNLLPNGIYGTHTKSGISFTRNSDGSIDASGTNTDSEVWSLSVMDAVWSNNTQGKHQLIDKYFDRTKEYVMSISDTNIHVALRILFYDANKTSISGSSINTYTKTNISFPSDAVYFIVRLIVSAGATITTGTVYPMIRLASIEDDTYEPYAKTNQQLTQETTALLDNTEVNGAVNYIYPIDSTKTDSAGVTWTLNSDNSVSVSSGGISPSTGTGFSYRNNNAAFLRGKTVTFKANVTGNTPTYDKLYFAVICRETENGANLVRYDVWPTVGQTEVTFTIPNNTNYLLIGCNIQNGATTAIDCKISPIVSLASYNGDYVPYAKSNRELTEEKLSLSVLKSVVADSSDFADFKTKIAAL